MWLVDFACFFYWRSPWIRINAPWRHFSIDLKFYMGAADVPIDSHIGYHGSTRPTSHQMEALNPKDHKSISEIFGFWNSIGLSVQTNISTTGKMYKHISTICLSVENLMIKKASCLGKKNYTVYSKNEGKWTRHDDRGKCACTPPIAFVLGVLGSFGPPSM